MKSNIGIIIDVISIMFFFIGAVFSLSVYIYCGELFDIFSQTGYIFAMTQFLAFCFYMYGLAIMLDLDLVNIKVFSVPHLVENELGQ